MKIRHIIPSPVRQFLLASHQYLIWPKAILKFRKNIYNERPVDRKLLNRLVYAWGNQGFSAKTEYLETCIEFISQTNRPVLECGSGLSTILLGIIAKSKGIKMYSLEHHPGWAQKVQAELTRFDLDNCHIHCMPLKTSEDYTWYDYSNLSLPFESFGLIICDGPPAQTPGGRFGLVPEITHLIKKNTVILVDDTIREQENEMINKWSHLLKFTEEKRGKTALHSILRVK